MKGLGRLERGAVGEGEMRMGPVEDGDWRGDRGRA